MTVEAETDVFSEDFANTKLLQLISSAESKRAELDVMLGQLQIYIEPVIDESVRQSDLMMYKREQYDSFLMSENYKFTTLVDNIITMSASSISSFLLPITEDEIRIEPEGVQSKADAHFYHVLSKRVQEKLKSPKVGFASVLLEAVKSCLVYGNAGLSIITAQTGREFKVTNTGLGSIAILDDASSKEIWFMTYTVIVSEPDIGIGREKPGTYKISYMDRRLKGVPNKLTESDTYPWVEYILLDNKVISIRPVINTGIVYGRFHLQAGKTYGFGSGIKALPALRDLSKYTRDYSSAALFNTNPPLYSSTVEGGKEPQGKKNISPGQLINIQSIPGIAPYIPMPMVLSTNELHQVIFDRIEHIKNAFHFEISALPDLAGTMSKVEVATRVDQKTTLLLPIVQTLQRELLEPVIMALVTSEIFEMFGSSTFPAAFSLSSLRLRYASRFDLVRKRTHGESLVAFFNSVIALAQVDPSLVGKLNMNKVLEQLADIHGVSPEVFTQDS